MRLLKTQVSWRHAKRSFSRLTFLDAIYKATKLSANGDVKANGRATVEDGEDEDITAGPELPPDEDVAEDEEGRFFGGGISNDTAEVLDFIDEQEKADIIVRATFAKFLMDLSSCRVAETRDNRLGLGSKAGFEFRKENYQEHRVAGQI